MVNQKYKVTVEVELSIPVFKDKKINGNIKTLAIETFMSEINFDTNKLFEFVFIEDHPEFEKINSAMFKRAKYKLVKVVKKRK